MAAGQCRPALLLGALVWSRKRRERQWEDVPAPAAAVETPPRRAEPVMESTGTAGAPLAEPPLPSRRLSISRKRRHR